LQIRPVSQTESARIKKRNTKKSRRTEKDPILDFVEEQQREGLERKVSAINIVTQKNILRIGKWPANAKQLEKVIELPGKSECAGNKKGGGGFSGATKSEKMAGVEEKKKAKEESEKSNPWMSPHTVTGVDTGCTLFSSRRTSFAFSHSMKKSSSGR